MLQKPPVLICADGGLTGEYFENVWFFYTPVRTVVDPMINFTWGQGLITPSASDFVSIRWTGRVLPEFTETYTFFVSSDDGARLWVDRALLFDHWDTSFDVSLMFSHI